MLEDFYVWLNYENKILQTKKVDHDKIVTFSWVQKEREVEIDQLGVGQ